MSGYNKYYKMENYFGNAYPELIEYFKSIDNTKKVLDIGCGQGRDTLALARIGFDITGVDTSSVGIEQLNRQLELESLTAKALILDKNEVAISDYDVILMDSMFHFYKNDIIEETAYLESIISDMKPMAILFLAVQYGDSRVKYLKNVIKRSKMIIQYEEVINYKEFSSDFYLISSQKE